MTALMYDIPTRRFTQPDTIIPGAADGQSFNRYTYVNNNPINANDPTGHCKWYYACLDETDDVIDAGVELTTDVVEAVVEGGGEAIEGGVDSFNYVAGQVQALEMETGQRLGEFGGVVRDGWNNGSHGSLTTAVLEVGAAFKGTVISNGSRYEGGLFCGQLMVCLVTGNQASPSCTTMGDVVSCNGNPTSMRLQAHEFFHVQDVEQQGGGRFYGSYLGYLATYSWWCKCLEHDRLPLEAAAIAFANSFVAGWDRIMSGTDPMLNSLGPGGP